MAAWPTWIGSVDMIRDEIARDGIARFFIDPKNQMKDEEPNIRATFILNSGKTYIVRGMYDAATNEFNLPVERPEPPPTLLKWDSMDRIFEDTDAYHPRIPEGYSDHEIDGKVNPSSFNPIFAELAAFQPEDYTFELKRIETILSRECALIRKWSSADSKLYFYITNEDFAIVFGTPTTFLIVKNQHSHPAVLTPQFTFDNSDGSTDIDVTLFPEFTLIQVKQLLREAALEYVFDQGH